MYYSLCKIYYIDWMKAVHNINLHITQHSIQLTSEFSFSLKCQSTFEWRKMKF